MADPIATSHQAPAEQQTAASITQPEKVYDAAYVKQVREEAKAHRERAEALEAKLAAEAKAKADAEAAKMLAEGKFKEFAEAERKRADEIAGKAAKADELAKELDAYKALELAALPEDIRADLSDLPPTKAIALARKWQAANAAPKAAPAVAGGQPAGSTVQASVSDLAKTPGAYASLPRNQQDAVAKSLGVWRRGSRRAE